MSESVRRDIRALADNVRHGIWSLSDDVLESVLDCLLGYCRTAEHVRQIQEFLRAVDGK